MDKNSKKGSRVRVTSDQFKDFMKKNKPDLSINRLPDDVTSGFKELAKTSFCDDFGWTLSFLYYYFLDDLKYQDLLDRVRDIEEVVNTDSKEKSKDASLTIKTCGNKEINIDKIRKDKKGGKDGKQK